MEGGDRRRKFPLPSFCLVFFREIEFSESLHKTIGDRPFRRITILWYTPVIQERKGGISFFEEAKNSSFFPFLFFLSSFRREEHFQGEESEVTMRRSYSTDKLNSSTEVVVVVRRHREYRSLRNNVSLKLGLKIEESIRSINLADGIFLLRP